MVENTNQIYIIENQNEKNVDQVLDINNEVLFEKGIENEFKLLDSQNIEEENKSKSKGYIRFLRKIIKTKDDHRKNILKNSFYEWRKQLLKGVTIKKIIYVRISLSKEKEIKDKKKNYLENGKEQRLINMNKNEMKSVNKIPKIPKNINSIKKEKIDNNNVKINNNKNDSNSKIILDNKNNNVSKESSKINKHYKGKVDEKNKIIETFKKNNNIIIKSIPHKQSLIQNNISKVNQNNFSQINIKEKAKNMNTINNSNIQYTEIKSSSKNKNNNPNYLNKTEIKNYQKKESLEKINSIPIPQKNYNNVNIIFISSTKKDKNLVPSNNSNNISLLKEDNRIKNYNSKTNDQNIVKDLSKKYEGYHDRKKYSILTNNTMKVDTKDKIKNEYNQYSSITRNSERRKASDNSFAKINTSDYNINRRTNNKQDTNNNISQKLESDAKGKNPRRSNWMYSQNTEKISKKGGGVTTVIQHYSGRKNLLDQNSYKNMNIKNRI